VLICWWSSDWPPMVGAGDGTSGGRRVVWSDDWASVHWRVGSNDWTSDIVRVGGDDDWFSSNGDLI